MCLIVQVGFFSIFGASGDAQARKVADDECLVVPYFAGKTINVPFVQSTRFSGVLGNAKVELNDRNVAQVKAEFRNLPNVLDVGGRFSTYVLWIVRPDGTTEIRGKLDTDGKDKTSNKDYEEKIGFGEFGLLLTIEPHHMVREPGVVVLRSGAPLGENSQLAKPRSVKCQFSEIDNFRTQKKLNPKEEKAFKNTPLLLLGAQYAVEMASEAGAQTAVGDLFNQADAAYQLTKDLWTRKRKQEEIESSAMRTIGLAADAEKQAIKIINERKQSREIRNRNDAIEETKDQLRKAEEERDRLKEDLKRVSAESEQWQNEYQTKKGQMESVDRVNAQLDAEVKKLRIDNFDLNIANRKLSTDLFRARGAKEWATELPVLEKQLMALGKVERTGTDGLLLTLPETIWELPDDGKLAPTWLLQSDALFTKIAEAKYLEVEVYSYVIAGEDLVLSKKIGDKRGLSVLAQFYNKGMATDRIKMDNRPQPAEPPVARKKPAKAIRAPNPNRIEILVKLLGEI